jgi:hypothetical protein
MACSAVSVPLSVSKWAKCKVVAISHIQKRLWHLVFNCAAAAAWLTDHYWRMHRGFYSPFSPCPFLSISLVCGFFPAPVTPNGHFFFPDRKEAGALCMERLHKKLVQQKWRVRHQPNIKTGRHQKYIQNETTLTHAIL